MCVCTAPPRTPSRLRLHVHMHQVGTVAVVRTASHRTQLHVHSCILSGVPRSSIRNAAQNRIRCSVNPWRRGAQSIKRFLNNSAKPVVLAMSRPDAKKNLTTLVKAFGTNQTLREVANLVLIMGNRDKVDNLTKGSQQIIVQVRMMLRYRSACGHSCHTDAVPLEQHRHAMLAHRGDLLRVSCM